MKREAGFSLLEIMCAILILGIALVALTEGITTALASSKDAEVQSAAALLASEQIETLRADGYLVAGESEGEGEGALAGYSWVQNVVESQPEGLYEVTVSVKKGDAGEEVFELKTLLFDPPLLQEPEEKDRNERNRGAGGRRRP